MDKEAFGDYAYCLKCYNKFKSYQKVLPVKQKRPSKIMSTKEARIEMLRKKLERLESELNICKEQENTGAR